MMIEFNPDGSFRVHTQKRPWWSTLGPALYWLMMGLLLGALAMRAYFIIVVGR